MEIEPVESLVGTVEEELVDEEDCFGNTEGNLHEETKMIVKRLKKIIAKRKTSEGIMLKKVGRRILKA